MKIIWGKTKIFSIEKENTEKLQKATDMVNSAIEGKIGFCYREVKKIPLYNENDLTNKIVRRKRAIAHEEYIASSIREEIKELKEKIKEYVLFDETTKKKLFSNYNKLNKALSLLFQNQIVDSYTITGNGRLKVNWYSVKERTTILIEQGLTYSISNDVGIRTQSTIVNECFPEARRDPETNEIIKKSQGVLHKKYEGPPKGGIAVDVRVLRYKREQDAQIPELKEMDKLFKGKTTKECWEYCVLFLALILKEVQNAKTE